MPHRSRDKQRNILPKTPTSTHNQLSLFFSDCELEYPLDEQPRNFEDPIEEEEEIASQEEPASPIQAMAENRTQGVFPIRETNGETRMKNLRPSTIPHFHGLTS